MNTQRLRLSGLVLALLVGALLLGGCANKNQAAREEFARKRSCPIDGVTAKERGDVSAHDRTFGGATPPKDIASDPARVAVWQDEQAKKRAKWDSGVTVFEVTGCNETGLYSCSQISSARNPNGAGQVSCRPIK